ncbi:hypothetical protein AKJ09_02145 [Labilithrix luteola]|uniref:HTH marR-type domain-containing protein n=1 Tax=Labilithrix luteola TaxID=1391654 RepID=A0A0K1PQ20_9BACT|nr:hypothetical protein [Labilithrix luteola]AKU95481.1 hypothetical protein AKJ09_02145 [Labilithrix luteola]
MDDGPIANEVEALLRDRIESLEQLELLLLLREHASESWLPSKAGVELGLAEPMATQALEHLVRGGLIVERSTESGRAFRYAPISAALVEAAGELARAYTERRGEVMRQLSANAVARVRAAASRMFSYSFLTARKRD